ncbi:hypothetical protein BT69DRAFT_1281956 [Atractiella rhizophila]|nr:hypothetical protein BT69DRAFT_1281956 [Atractiella rhizophila]
MLQNPPKSSNKRPKIEVVSTPEEGRKEEVGMEIEESVAVMERNEGDTDLVERVKSFLNRTKEPSSEGDGRGSSIVGGGAGEGEAVELEKMDDSESEPASSSASSTSSSDSDSDWGSSDSDLQSFKDSLAVIDGAMEAAKEKGEQKEVDILLKLKVELLEEMEAHLNRREEAG